MARLALGEAVRARVALDGGPGEVGGVSDGAQAHALCLQGHDLLVARQTTCTALLMVLFVAGHAPTPTAGGCLLLGARHREGCRQRLGAEGNGKRFHRCGRLAQAGLLAREETPHRIRHILQQVETVGHLDRQRSALADPVGVRPRTITADHLHLRMLTYTVIRMPS